VGRPARPEVLEEIARVTRGKVIEPDKLDEVVRSLAELPDPPPSVRRVQLWCHPVLGAAVVVQLGLFWVGRKVIGLVSVPQGVETGRMNQSCEQYPTPAISPVSSGP
jgi:hypothetical protein